MMYVINANWGGFSVPAEVDDVLHCGTYAFDYEGDIRTNEVLVEWVKAHPNDSDLALVEIPDEATDWRLDEYDGYESIIAVIDGRIVDLDTIDFDED